MQATLAQPTGRKLGGEVKKLSRRIKRSSSRVMFPRKRESAMGTRIKTRPARAKQAAYLLERDGLVGDVFEGMIPTLHAKSPVIR